MLGLSRLGVRLVRFEWGGMANDFRNGDVIMRVLEEAKIKAMVTLGAHPYHTMPLGEPTPAPSPWKPDHTAMPKYDDAFGKWVFDFCMRYWKGGDGALWGIEHWIETGSHAIASSSRSSPTTPTRSTRASRPVPRAPS
jgi:hypothetical protein